jgi:hypothetical protein
MRRALLVVVTSLSLAACHAQAPGSGRRTARNVITQEEIESSNASNLYDLIASLRGDFLKDRGTISIKTNTHERAVVFLNDQEYGILETLRNIPPGRVSEIRYISGIDAVNRFGSQYGGGIVMLVSKNQ